MKTLKNVSLVDFRRFLKLIGCQYVRTKGGHEIWTKLGLTRPVVIQNHIDPVPEFIIKRLLQTLNINKDQFLALI